MVVQTSYHLNWVDLSILICLFIIDFNKIETAELDCLESESSWVAGLAAMDTKSGQC